MTRLLILALALFSLPAFADAGVRDAGLLDSGLSDGGVKVDTIAITVADPIIILGDAGVEVADAGVVDAGFDGGIIVTEDGGIVIVQEALDHPLGSVQNFYVAAKEGNWWVAAMFFLLAVVGFFRVAGKKLHDWIPDDSAWDRPLFFIYDTKVGGWILNWLTAISGALIMAHKAGIKVDGDTWKVAFLASTGSTAIVELWQDVSEWLKKRKEKKAAEAAAKPVDPPVAPVP